MKYGNFSKLGKYLFCVFCITLVGCSSKHVKDTEKEWENKSSYLLGMKVAKLQHCAGLPYKIEETAGILNIYYGAAVYWSHATEYCQLILTTDKEKVVEVHVNSDNPGGLLNGTRICTYIMQGCISERNWTLEAAKEGIVVVKIGSDEGLLRAKRYGVKASTEVYRAMHTGQTSSVSTDPETIENAWYNLTKSSSVKDRTPEYLQNEKFLISYGVPTDAVVLLNQEFRDRYTQHYIGSFDLWFRNSSTTDYMYEFEYKVDIRNKTSKPMKFGLSFETPERIGSWDLFHDTENTAGKKWLEPYQSVSTGWKKWYQPLNGVSPKVNQEKWQVSISGQLADTSSNDASYQGQ